MLPVYRLFAFLACRLPRGAAGKLAWTLAWLRWLTTPVLRRRIRENYLVALRQEHFEPAEISRLARRAYFNFALYLVEFFASPGLNPGNIRERISVRGEEHLEKAFARGRGVISLTAHLGNWEMAGIATSLLGYPVTAVALAQPDPGVNRLFMSRRRSKGVRIFLLGGSARMLLSALRRNELVAILNDRVFGPPSVRVPFFGLETDLPAGPAQMAVRTGASVVPGFMVRENGRLVLCFEPGMVPDASLPAPAAVSGLLRDFVACLEKYITRYPDQWLVFSRVWERPAPAAAAHGRP